MQIVLKIDTPFQNRKPSLTTSYKSDYYIVLSYQPIIFSFASITTILLQVVLCMLSLFSQVRLFATLWTIILCPQDSPGRNTGVGCHALLQGIFPTQGSNLHLLNLTALAGGFFTTVTTWEALRYYCFILTLRKNYNQLVPYLHHTHHLISKRWQTVVCNAKHIVNI